VSELYVPAYSIAISEGGQALQPITVEQRSGVKSVEVSNHIDKSDTFSLKLDNEHHKYSDDPVFVEGNGVSILMGYKGRLRGMMLGEIKVITGDFAEEETMDLQGVDATMTDLGVAVGNRKFKSLRDSDIVKSIAKEAISRVGPRSLKKFYIAKTEIGPQFDAYLKSDKKAEVTLKSSTTAYQFIRRLANRNSFLFFIRNQILFFLPPHMQEQPDYTYAYKMPGTPELSRIEKLSWKLSTQKQPRVVSGNVGLDGKPLPEVSSTSSNKQLQTTNNPNDDAAGVDKTVDRDNRTKGYVAVDDTQLGISRRTDHLFVDHEFVLEATATHRGEPNMRAGLTVEWMGIGNRLSGKWFVRSVKHIYSEAGYVNQTVGVRNALGPISVQFEPKSRMVQQGADIPANVKRSNRLSREDLVDGSASEEEAIAALRGSEAARLLASEGVL